MASPCASIIHFALCQAADPPSHSNAGDQGAGVIPLLALLVGIVILGIAAAAIVRRWLRRSDDPSEGFSLSDLREMHAAGDLTDIEFRAAREAMVARLKQKVTTGSKDEAKYTRKKNS